LFHSLGPKVALSEAEGRISHVVDFLQMQILHLAQNDSQKRVFPKPVESFLLFAGFGMAKAMP
ncbi:MAG: hypothetical protein ACRD22_21810, partial [Terriglobia bacterium]